MKRTLFVLPIALIALSCGDGHSPNEDSIVSDSLDPVATHRVTPTEPVSTAAPTGSTEPGDGNISPRKADEKVRLVVSFISQGEGIDRKTNEAFVAWVKQKGNIAYDANNWGREGEINYCFALDNLSPAEQDKFVEEARAQLNGRPLVKFNENTSCENWK